MGNGAFDTFCFELCNVSKIAGKTFDVKLPSPIAKRATYVESRRGYRTMSEFHLFSAGLILRFGSVDVNGIPLRL